jgi:hypothetical protein
VNDIYAHYTSGSTLYAVIRDRLCQVWAPVVGALEEWGQQDRGVADYAIPLNDKSGSLYAADMPSEITQGTYNITIFVQAGAAPADEDEIVDSRQIYFGSGVITAEKLLAGRAIQDKISGQITYYDDDGCTAILTLIPNEDAGSISRMLA